MLKVWDTVSPHPSVGGENLPSAQCRNYGQQLMTAQKDWA